MKPERWRQIDELLLNALERDPSERSEYLRLAAGDDSELRREVGSLIEAAGEGEAFFDQPAMGGVASLLGADDEDPRELIGRRLGAYRVEGVIATGGMGAVCLGVRDDDAFTMRVAIKLVRRGAGGSSDDWHDERLRRFHLERQVLAELEHPSIARLIDGGTGEDGRPYLVMEHVNGLPIDEHCERAGLTMTQRLRLFVLVCRAVQHAHLRLIIHRDLKPSNILVTPAGEPKLLDFGLAKLLDTHRAALRSGQTQAGQFMGTIAYAAPEQVSGAARDQDARTDVYALGMILYRLVAGRSAYTTDGSISDVLDRITRLVPPPPSSVNPRVGRELDTIVMKAIAKERDRRYQSAAELGDDVERLLAGEPVRARGTGRWYVLRKAVWRHRIGVAAFAGVLVLIVGFAAAMAGQASRLAVRSGELEAALRTSNIERARTLASTGSTVEAEQVLWGELLASIPGVPTPETLASGDAGAYWALWELYARDPCRWSAPVPGLPDDLPHLSPDGQRVLVWSRSEVPRIYDAQSGALIGSLPLGASGVCAATFAGADDGVVYALPDGTVSKWAPGDAEAEFVAASGLEAPTSVRVTEDGRVLVGANGGAVVIERGDPSRVHALEIPTPRVRNIEMSPDGSVIAIAADDGHVRLYDGGSYQQTATLLEPERWTAFLAFSPDGRYLATDVNGADVAIIDVRERAVVARMTDVSGWLSSLRFHPERTEPALLLASSFDKSAYLWEAPSGRLVRQLAGHTTQLYDAVFGPDGQTVVALGAEAVRAWDIGTDARGFRWTEPDTIFDAEFTPDGSQLVTASGDRSNRVTVREARDGAVQRVLGGHDGAVTTIAFTPDARSVISGSFDGSISVWDLTASPQDAPAGRTLVPADPRRVVVNSIDVAPDGRTFAAASDDGAVRVRRVEDGALVEEIPAGPDRVPSVAFSRDGRWLAAAIARTHAVLLRDLQTGEDRTLAAHDQLTRVVGFSPDGSLLASAGDDLVIRLWSMLPGRVGEPEGELAGHSADIFALAFAPGGELLASAGRGGDVKLWDVATGRCLVTIRAHDDMVFTLAFSPDGRSLVSAGRDQTIAVWRLDAFDAHLKGNFEFHRERVRAAR